VATRSSPDRRRAKRTALKMPASLIVKNGRQAQPIPCLILDNSQTGFKIAGTFILKKGQTVELILDEYSSNTVQQGDVDRQNRL